MARKHDLETAFVVTAGAVGGYHYDRGQWVPMDFHFGQRVTGRDLCAAPEKPESSEAERYFSEGWIKPLEEKEHEGEPDHDPSPRGKR